MPDYSDGELPDRIWAKVDKVPGGCWLWTGGCTRKGYGKTYLDGKQVYVHRAVYEALVWEIPAGGQLDHACHVERCCNPGHLAVVDNTANGQNRRGAQSNSKSGVRGVHRQDGKWRVMVAAGGRRHSGGLFDDLEAAAAAARRLRAELMGNSPG